MKKNKIAQSLLGLCVAGVMSVGADVVIQYSFPASYDGTGTTITDLSTAGNDATHNTSGAPLIDDRPAGFAATQMSLGSSNGGARIDGNSPMTTTTVAANNGFIFDVWFKTADTVGSKLVSNGGYENLYTQNGNLIFSVDNGTAVTFTGLTVGQWYHASAQFDTTGNSLVSGNIAGVARLYVDGTLIGSSNKTMQNRGPDGSRGLAINMHPVNGAEANTGIIFNPSVELIPEPGTLGMVALFGGGLLFIRRKMMI